MRIINFIVFIIILLSSRTLFSANIYINNDFVKNYHKIEFTDKSNKVGIKLEENKILSLNILKLEQKNFKIQNSKIIENEYLIFDENNYYNLNFNYNSMQLYSTIPVLNEDSVDIKSVKFTCNNLVLQTSFYHLKEQVNDEFYFNYQSLNFTQKGIVNYISFSYKNLSLENEIVLSKYGVFMSYKALYTFNNLKFFFTTKNIKEKYIYGFIFENSMAKVEVVDKIYELSIYGGQGVKRNFQISSDLKIPIETDLYKSTFYLSTHHEIDYDVCLNKSINQIYRIRNKFIYKDYNIESSIRLGEKLSAYFIINNLKISYYNKKFDFNFIIEKSQKNSYFKLDFSLEGNFQISYTYSL
jgi:hypothetical protein